jgi:acyl transferase domain-containing protein/acyl carrier protein
MADDERILKRLALQGITPLEAGEAHGALEKLLTSNTVQATVMDVDWRRMRTGPTGEVPAMLQELVGSRKKSRAVDSALIAKLKQLRGNAQRELLLKTIQDSLQVILSTPDVPETDRPLIEMGLDSLMAVEFGTELQQMLGDQFNIGPTMLFDHPTIDAITDFVLDLVVSEASDTSAGESRSAGAVSADDQPLQTAREDVAIVGMSCRFPGAENLDEFWQNLLNGVDSVCDIPGDRWDIDRFYSADREPGKMYTRRGGFLDDIADFDAAFFNISDQEACWIDPQHRMLLENSYRAMEDAGIPVAPLTDPNVGVFMGIMGSDYAFLPTLDDEDIIKGFQGAGLSHSAGVGRISYLFGFEGPSVAVDTASSSSLVAVFQAMRSLQDGNCNLALAGGVNAILAPVNSLLMSKAGLLSPDGRCKSFSKSADGFGRGEGCGVVVLKRLSDAERDGDRIMAVIRGGAVVHNGFSGGITSPSGKAQTRVIDAAIKDAKLAPSQVQYLEAHGTGTEYGDPMELGAAVKIYGKGRSKDNPLLVGSVKANISHLEAAGGSSGLIKTVLAIHRGVIPPQANFDEPSPHIPWKRMPVKMVSETTDWPECDRRTAGITGLGLVGTNAHLVLSSPESNVAVEAAETGSKDDSVPEKGRLLVVSARCENALQALAQRYLNFLETHPQTDLDDFCFTIGSGRRQLELRMAIPFSSYGDLIGKLKKAVGHNNLLVEGNRNGNGAANIGLSQKKAAQVARSPKIAWAFGEDVLDVRSTLQELIETYSVVAEFVTDCEQRLSEHVAKSGEAASGQELSLIELIASSETECARIQTLQYVFQAGLSKLWQSWGIHPDVAVGYGVGQYAAACVAGGLCLFDALVLVHERESLLGKSAEDADWDAFENLADQCNFYPPNMPLVCSMSGEVVPIHRSLGGSYWRQQATSEMKYDQSSKAFLGLDCQIGLIIGQMDESKLLVAANKSDGPFLIRSKSSTEKTSDSTLLATLGQLYQHGCTPDFAAVFGRRRRLSLPTYPFQKKRYWITEISQFMEPEETPEAKPIHS